MPLAHSARRRSTSSRNEVTVNRHGSICITPRPALLAPRTTTATPDPHDVLMSDSARALGRARAAVRSSVSSVHSGQLLEARMGARVRAQRLSPTRVATPLASSRLLAESVPHGAEAYCERVRVDITSVLGAIRGILDVDATRWSPPASPATTHAELLSDLMAAVLRFKREWERRALSPRDIGEPSEHSSGLAELLEQHDSDIALLRAKGALDIGIALDAQRAEFEDSSAAELSGAARGSAAALRAENEQVRRALHEQTELVATLQHAARAAARRGEQVEERRAAQEHGGFERLARLEHEQRAAREAVLVAELRAAQLAVQRERDERAADEEAREEAREVARGVSRPATLPEQREAPAVRDAASSPMESPCESVQIDREAEARSRSAAVAAAVDSEKRRGGAALAEAQARSAAALARTKAHSAAALANAKELWTEQRVGAIESEVKAMRSRVETRMASVAESEQLRAEARIRRECSTLVTRAQDTFEEETASALAEHRESQREAQSARAKARALEEELEIARAARRDAEVALAAALEDASAAAEVTASEVRERAALDAAKRVQDVTRRLGDAHAAELEGALADGKALRLENARLQREQKELEKTHHATFEQALRLESQRLEEESATKLEDQRRLFEVKFDEALLAHINTVDTMMGEGGSGVQQEVALAPAWGPQWPASRSGGRAGDAWAPPAQFDGLGSAGATGAGPDGYDAHRYDAQLAHGQRACGADMAPPDDVADATQYSQYVQNSQQQQLLQQPRVHVSRRGSIDIDTSGAIRFASHGAGGRAAHGAGGALPASLEHEHVLQASQYATARQIFDARTQAGTMPLAYSSLAM